MISRCLFIIFGVGLLLVAGAGVVAWVTGFTALQQALLYGVPWIVAMSSTGTPIRIPGRVIGLISIVVPLLGMLGGFWLLRLAFERDDEK
jgi:hypothetical protein